MKCKYENRFQDLDIYGALWVDLSHDVNQERALVSKVTKNKIQVVWGVTTCGYVDRHLQFKLHGVTSQNIAAFTSVRTSSVIMIILLRVQQGERNYSAAELAFSIALNVSCTERQYCRMTACSYNVSLIRVDRWPSHARNPSIST